MRKRSSASTLVLCFIAGLGAAVVLQLLGVAVVPPDKTSTLIGVLAGAVFGFVLLKARSRLTRTGRG